MTIKHKSIIPFAMTNCTEILEGDHHSFTDVRYILKDELYLKKKNFPDIIFLKGMYMDYVFTFEIEECGNITGSPKLTVINYKVEPYDDYSLKLIKII